MNCQYPKEAKADMDIQDNIAIGASCASLSFLLYKTDALVEYARLLRLDKFIYLTQYLCFKINNQDNNYFDFLKQKNYNFFTKLLACPFCLGFWFCAIWSKFSFSTLFSYCVYIIVYKIMNRL